jgi:hypothetical protein
MKMASMEETRVAAADFLRKCLNAEDVKVVRISRVSDGWETEDEVYEENSFIKALGLPTRVMDRNIYSVKLNDNLEVISYERKAPA